VAELSDIQNESIRREIEEYVEQETEIERLIGIFAAAKPLHQDMAAALIEGEHHRVDELAAQAIAAGTEALEVMDEGLIAAMGIVGIKFRENRRPMRMIGSSAGLIHLPPCRADRCWMPDAGLVETRCVR